MNQKELQQFRKSLPVFGYKNKIIQHLKENDVIIICGDTGSGKTTQIPQFIYEENIHRRKLIGITQPRRIAAITTAQRVAQEMNVDLGMLVGYSVRFDELIDYSITKIKFLTDGMLLREMIIDSNLKRYSVLIIDEAHERSLCSDILIGLIKLLKDKRKKLKIVIMSATLETVKFQKFFPSAKILNVEGRCYPIEIFYTINPLPDYLDGALNTILQVHFKEGPGHMLIFLTGQEEIEDLNQMLMSRIESFQNEFKMHPMQICPLYSALPPEKQMLAFEKITLNESVYIRKIILSTNIAETSVTIPGIKYVVDTGFVKVRYYDYLNGFESLSVIPTSKASSLQRAGRAGREQPGMCFRLYTEEGFKQLSDYGIPEILRTNLASTILQIKAIGQFDLDQFPFVDHPKKERINKAIKILQNIGGLDNYGNITDFGKDLSEFPLDPIQTFLLFASTQPETSCHEEMLSIVAIMNAENFIIKTRLGTKMHSGFRKFHIENSDHLTKLNILHHYIKTPNKKAFCREYGINSKAVKKAVLIRVQLEAYMNNIKKKEKEDQKGSIINYKKLVMKGNMKEVYENLKVSLEFRIDQIIKCLAKGMKYNTAKLNNYGCYTLQNMDTGAIHPDSVLFYTKKKPQAIVYSEVIITKKTYLRDVTEIPLELLN